MSSGPVIKAPRSSYDNEMTPRLLIILISATFSRSRPFLPVTVSFSLSASCHCHISQSVLAPAPVTVAPLPLSLLPQAHIYSLSFSA